MTPSDPPSSRPSSKSRKRAPVTLDLKAKEIQPRPGEAENESSLTDDPRTPAHPPERETASDTSLVGDPRTSAETPHPTPSEIEAAVAQLAPEAAAGPLVEDPQEPSSAPEPRKTTAAEIPPTQDIGEAPPPELAPGSPSAEAAAAMPAGAAPDRLDEEVSGAATRTAEPTRRRGAGFGALLAASLLGGVAGAALTFAAERFWLKRPDPSAARIAQLEQRLASAPASPDAGAIERRLAALEAQQREQAQRLQAAQSATQQAAQRAEDALSRPAAAASAGGSPALDPAAFEPINSRIDAFETALRARVQEVAQQAEQRGDELRARFANQAKQIEAFAGQIRALSQGLDAAGSQTAEQGQRVAAIDRQLGQLSQKVDALTKQFSERGPETTAGLRVVAADRVLDALRDGAPFPQALAALKRLNVDPQRLAALEPFAGSGAPTAAALAQEFKPLGERMVAEARGPATSWSDRFARMAEGIVSIKPVGEAGATSIPALVARIENALARGAVADAASAFDDLPDEAWRATEDFGRKLKARAAAEEAARTISNQALAALDASGR